MPDRLSTRAEDSVLQMESNNVSLIELLRQFRRVTILHFVETMTYSSDLVDKESCFDIFLLN